MRHQACRLPYCPAVVTGPMRGTFRWFENAGMRTTGPTVIDEVVLTKRRQHTFPHRLVVDVETHAPFIVASANDIRPQRHGTGRDGGGGGYPAPLSEVIRRVVQPIPPDEDAPAAEPAAIGSRSIRAVMRCDTPRRRGPVLKWCGSTASW